MNKIKEVLQEAKDLIGKDQTKKALKLINRKINFTFLFTKTKVLLLIARVSRLDRKYRSGTITEDKHDTIKNKINFDALKVIEQIGNKNKINLIKFTSIFLALTSASLLVFSFFINNEGVAISKPIISKNLLIYDIDFNEKSPPTYSLTFKIKSKDTSNYKLARFMKIVKTNDQSKILSRTFELNPKTYKQVQKINIDFQNKGQYQLHIPFSTPIEKINQDSYNFVITNLNSSLEVPWQSLKFYHLLKRQKTKLLLGFCFLINTFVFILLKQFT